MCLNVKLHVLRMFFEEAKQFILREGNEKNNGLIGRLSSVLLVFARLKTCSVFAYCVFFHVFFSSASFLSSKSTFFVKSFREYHQNVKQFGYTSGPTFCWAWAGSKLFAKVNSRRVGKELMDTYA